MSRRALSTLIKLIFVSGLAYTSFFLLDHIGMDAGLFTVYTNHLKVCPFAEMEILSIALIVTTVTCFALLGFNSWLLKGSDSDSLDDREAEAEALKKRIQAERRIKQCA